MGNDRIDNSTKKIILGIDGDVDYNGVCIMKDDGSFTYTKMKLVDLMAYFDDLSQNVNLNVIIIVEAGYLNKKVNFHHVQGLAGQRVSYSVGRNHQSSLSIVEIAKYFGLNVIEQKPLKHKWKKGKISAEEFNELTGHKGRSNQDERDAALLVFNYLGKV